MTKIKNIQENEEFIAKGIVFTWSSDGAKIVFKPIRKHDKAVKVSKPVNIPSEQEIKKYAIDNGYDPEFMWERAKGYIDAGMKDSQGNDVKNLKLKLNQVWFVDKNKIKKETKESFFQE